MAKAAYCAACGANVYVTDDGTCPQGHAPENLSNFYEAPDLSPADHAVMDATAPVEKRKTNRTLIIVLVIVALIIVCGIGSCVAGVLGLAAFSDSGTSTTEELVDTGASIEASADANSLMPGVDLSSELYAVAAHFFPAFGPTGYYLIGDGTDDPVEFQVIVAADEIPAFKMAFSAYRYSGASLSADDDPAWYFATDSGAVWERLAEDDTEGATLYDFAGADPMLSAENSAQIMAQFSSAHPGMVLTGMDLVSNVEIALVGISEGELEGWDGTATSFRSTWKNDLASSTWSETGFSADGQ